MIAAEARCANNALPARAAAHAMPRSPRTFFMSFDCISIPLPPAVLTAGNDNDLCQTNHTADKDYTRQRIHLLRVRPDYATANCQMESENSGFAHKFLDLSATS